MAWHPLCFADDDFATLSFLREMERSLLGASKWIIKVHQTLNSASSVPASGLRAPRERLCVW